MNTCIGLFCAFSFLPLNLADGDRPTFVDQVPIVQILSEPEGNAIHQMSVNLDDEGRILEVIRHSEDSDAVIAFQALIDGEVVVAQAKGRDALILSCPGCSYDGGGTLVFRYLENALSNSWGTMNISLATEEGTWLLATNENVQVQTMTMTSRKIFGQVVGIKEILINDW